MQEMNAEADYYDRASEGYLGKLREPEPRGFSRGQDGNTDRIRVGGYQAWEWTE